MPGLQVDVQSCFGQVENLSYGRQTLPNSGEFGYKNGTPTVSPSLRPPFTLMTLPGPPSAPIPQTSLAAKET